MVGHAIDAMGVEVVALVEFVDVCVERTFIFEVYGVLTVLCRKDDVHYVGDVAHDWLFWSSLSEADVACWISLTPRMASAEAPAMRGANRWISLFEALLAPHEWPPLRLRPCVGLTGG